uniref:Transposase (Putative), gypsy type n=1 Tax=Tanacetum cinerariifolium TaxID=118510 RepID=A0A6L2K804_TANCI|nr:hypothetical protein [Tanacetum cinerariifolium]
MDLLSFIRTADPTNVRVAERQRVKNEPRLLESTIGRVVPLLPIAPARASSKLEASVDKLFDEGDSGDGQGTDIQPVTATTDTMVKDVALLQPRRQRKRKTAVADDSGPSHPPKKLREDYGALGGASTAERDDKSPGDSVTGLNLRTFGALQRFVISSDSSHHFGANIAEAEVNSIVRSSAPAIATITTVTAAVDVDTTADRVPVGPSFFGVASSSNGRTDYVLGGFFDVSGSDFLIGGIRTVIDPDSNLQKIYVSQWSATNGFGLDDSCICREMLDEFAPSKFFAFVRGMDHDQLFIEFNVGAARQISMSTEVRDGEIESLKAQLLLKEAEAAEAIHLQAEVFKFEAAEKSLQGEVRVLRDHSATLEREREKNELSVKVTDLSTSVKVHELEVSSVGLQEKVAAYKDFIGQLEKFQDKKIEEVNEKFDKLCANFVDMALHPEEKFYPHLLTTIYGRRWLLTHGMELVVVRCLNSTEYMSALGAAISKAVEKGMQEGLSAGITHGAKGRKLADVAVYNPSAKADYLYALQRLQNLMVPIHHSLDQRVVGASALSLSLDVSHSRFRKIRENIASHVSALRSVFVPLSEPLSAAALEGTEGTSGSAHDTTTTLSVISASTIPPISTDDYEVAHADGQGAPVWMVKPQLLGTLISFSDVSNVELNILESELASVFHMACFVALVDIVSWTEAGASNPGVIISFHSGFIPYFLNCDLLSLFSSKRSKLMPKASLFLTMSTSVVLKVGRPISAGITAFAP